jgi:hypothetical protein
MKLTKWLKNKVRRWVNQDDYPEPEDVAITSPYGSNIRSKRANVRLEADGGLNFTVYPAVGGKVVQLTTYDPRTDRSKSNLYVVTDKEDLGSELGQIITVESLSR